MQKGNFIDVFLAQHVSGTYVHHQEHLMLSRRIWFVHRVFRRIVVLRATAQFLCTVWLVSYTSIIHFHNANGKRIQLPHHRKHSLQYVDRMDIVARETIEFYYVNNNNNNIYLLQLGCHPVAVVILHVYKICNWLLINLSLEGYMRSMQWQLGMLGTI